MREPGALDRPEACGAAVGGLAGQAGGGVVLLWVGLLSWAFAAVSEEDPEAQGRAVCCGIISSAGAALSYCSLVLCGSGSLRLVPL